MCIFLSTVLNSAVLELYQCHVFIGQEIFCEMMIKRLFNQRNNPFKDHYN